MLRIRELLFDEWNEEHIIRHNVIPEERVSIIQSLREMRHKQNGACISARENKMDEQKKSQIPEFKTIAEEAAFWDTHDTTDFEDEFEEIEVEFKGPYEPPTTLDH
jgi:hypothetical protein